MALTWPSRGKEIPLRLCTPSGRLSGPTLKPGRCFFGLGSDAPSSAGLLDAIVRACTVSFGFFKRLMLLLPCVVLSPVVDQYNMLKAGLRAKSSRFAGVQI